MYANYQNNSINEKKYFLGIDDTHERPNFKLYVRVILMAFYLVK